MHLSQLSRKAAYTVITRQIPAAVNLDLTAHLSRRLWTSQQQHMPNAGMTTSQIAVASNSQNNYRLDATCAVRLATLSALQRGQRDERVVAHSPPWGTALSMPAAPQVRRLL